MGILCANLRGPRARIRTSLSLSRSRFFIHCFAIGAGALLAGELAQELSYNLRALIRLLLDLTLADRVEGAKEPHFLQVAYEGLQVFCGFDLCGDELDCRMAYVVNNMQTYQMRCLDLHLELKVGSRVAVGLGDLRVAEEVSH